MGSKRKLFLWEVKFLEVVQRSNCHSMLRGKYPGPNAKGRSKLVSVSQLSP